MRTSTMLAGAALAVSASAQKAYSGFNSGATLDDSSAKFKADFMAEFETAQNLEGAPVKFNSVRLYTNIQAYSETDPIEAFEAAIETETNMLLGVWASQVENIDNEIAALQKAVDKWGKTFTDLVIGVSIGSEDLYRNSVTGVENDAGVGTDPDVLVGFIQDFRDAFKDSALSSVPLGHVDTWDVWPNTTNAAVLEAVDWIGVDEYPYYEGGKGNHIDNSGQLFDKAYEITLAAANGKPVWVTETGWPVTGIDWDEAEPSIANAKYFWDEVGCRQLFGQVPTFWYTLRDSNPDNKQKFAITKDLSTKPLFDLTCPTTFETPESDSTTTSSAPKPTKTNSGNGGNNSDNDEESTSTFSAPDPTGTADDTSDSDAAEEDTTEDEDGEGAASSMHVASAAYFGLAAAFGFALL